MPGSSLRFPRMGNTHDKPLPSLQERLPAHDQPGLARQSAGVASTSEQPNHRAKNGRQKPSQLLRLRIGCNSTRALLKLQVILNKGSVLRPIVLEVRQGFAQRLKQKSLQQLSVALNSQHGANRVS